MVVCRKQRAFFIELINFAVNLVQSYMKFRKFFIIALHLLAWLAFYFLPDLLFDAPAGEISMIKRNLHFVLVVVFFYLNYFLFVPYLLLRKRQILFALVLIMSLVFTYYVNDAVMLYVHHKYFQRPAVSKEMTPKQRANRLRRWEHRRAAENTGTAMFVLLGFLISTVLYETKEWYEQERKRKEIEKEKLVSELSFLKSQVNPHFLFNSLNGIYALAIKKSDKTPEAVLQLSDLLRHMLYDADQGKVQLSKEIDYLKNYIQLQKMRLSEEAEISLETSGPLSDYEIEPLLFIPFVENAFKHGVDANGADIKINLTVEKNKLHFKMSNRISQAKSKDGASGIGLSNVKKRLELNYGSHYKLNYGAEKGYFHVDLQINV